MPALKKITGDSEEILPLQHGATTIGRSAGNQVVISANIVSKIHAVVIRDGSRCTLEGKGANGTYLNGRRLVEIVKLVDGDEFQIASVRFVFQEHESDTERAKHGHRIPRLRLLKSVGIDSDPSIRHQTFQLQNGLIVDFDEDPCEIRPQKIRASILLAEQTLSSMTPTNPAKKLSHLLRFVEAVRQHAANSNFQPVVESLRWLFPQTTQIALMTEFSHDFSDCVIAGAACRDDSERVVVCRDLVHRVAKKCECLLLSDIWRIAPARNPTLSDMQRVCLLCAPVRDETGCCAVLQLIAAAADPEFDAEDLERLAMLAEVLSIVLQRRHSS